MIPILEAQMALEKTRQCYAVVTIVSASGSTPREHGKMLVNDAGYVAGTIGGGEAEYLAIRDAKELLPRGQNAVKTYTLRGEKSDTKMTCGGTITVLFEIYAEKPLLVMIGAGHVGTAVLSMARPLGFETLLIDDRPEADIRSAIELAGRYLPTSDYYKDILSLDIPDNAYFVIATHGHAYDGTALAAVLKKRFSYAGMIGSREKINGVFRKLLNEGYDQELLDSVYTPIGLDLGGETPEEIALSIMSEVQMIRRGGSGKHMREVK